MKGRSVQALILSAIFSGFDAPVEAASYKEWRGAIKEADEARIRHDFEKARRILEGMESEAARHGPESFAENSDLLAIVLNNSGEPDKAVQVVNAALEKLGAPSRRSSIIWKGILLANRATYLKDLKNYDRALADAENGRILIGKSAGFNHPELGPIYWVIGEIATAKKDYTKAEEAYRSGLQIAETRQEKVIAGGGRYARTLSDYSSSGILLNTTGLGAVCMLQKREKDAEEHFTRGLKFAEKEYGKNHQATVVPLSGRAALYYTMKRRAEFEEDTRRIVAIAEKGPGVRPQYVAPLWLKLRWELEDGDRKAAEQTADRVATVFAMQNYGTKLLAGSALRVASLAEKDDRARVATVQDLIRKAATKKFGESPATLGPLLAEFALDAERAKELGLARYNYEQILKMHEGVGDPGIYAATAEKIADIFLAQNKPAEALPYLQKVTVKIREKYGEDSRVGFAMEREAVVLKQLGRAEEAREMEKKALAEHGKAMLKR